MILLCIFIAMFSTLIALQAVMCYQFVALPYFRAMKFVDWVIFIIVFVSTFRCVYNGYMAQLPDYIKSAL